jgi:hypothetical protein
VLQSQSSVRVIHAATGFDFGEMRTKSGGAKSGDNQLIRPGGMAPPVAFAGSYTYGPVTVGRLLRHGIDSGLRQKANDFHGERFTIIEQPLDEKGRPGFHRPITHSGLLNTSTPTDVDTDGNNPMVLDMEFTIDSVV